MSKSQRFTDGHYEFGLPFHEEKPNLPSNQFLALQRLKTLKKKLMSNPTFYEDYKKFMKVLLDLEYAEKVPNSEISRKDNKVWYLPHHGIYHPNKPKKIRVVFDCSAKFNNTSINDVLLQGPVLTNRLLSVLLRFPQESIAILGDIEKMFYQVKVPKMIEIV